jgi:1-acylglycerone phosphate reductase
MTLDSVLVTGCSAGGIGSEIAIEFQKQGLHVFATARDVNKLAHFKDLAKVTILPLDVTSKQSVEAVIEAVKKSERGGGKLKYLVNNAGVHFSRYLCATGGTILTTLSPLLNGGLHLSSSTTTGL